MTKYEYTMWVGRLNIDILNEYGKDGWLYVDRIDGPAGSGESVVFFSRAKEKYYDAQSEELAEAPKKAAKKQAKELASE
jgi:hypothetical protein